MAVGMTAQQRYAIENYCLLAFECADPRFGRVVGDFKVCMTVNAGWE